MRLPSRRAHALLIAATLGAGALVAAFDQPPATTAQEVAAGSDGTPRADGGRDRRSPGDGAAGGCTDTDADAEDRADTDDRADTAVACEPATTSTTGADADSANAAGNGQGAAGPPTGLGPTNGPGRDTDRSDPGPGAPTDDPSPGDGNAEPAPSGDGSGPPPERPDRTDDGYGGDPLDWQPGPILTGGPTPCVPTGSAPDVFGLIVLDLGAGCLRVLIDSNHQPNGSPSWSPDGTWLLTIDDYNRPVRIAADGSWYQVLTDNYVHQAVLSPDGSRVAGMVWQPDGIFHLVIVGIDGTGARRLGTFPWPANGGLQWSPDGRYLALDSGGVAVVAVDGSGTWRWDGNASNPAWSPDGILAMADGGTPGSIGLAFAGPDLVALGAGHRSGPDHTVAWSRPQWLDRHRVLYVGWASGSALPTTTYVLDLTTGQSALALADARQASVGPDGRTVAFAQHDGVSTFATGVAIGTIGGPRTTVWAVGANRPSDWLLAPPGWSPDGTRLAMAVAKPF